ASTSRKFDVAAAGNERLAAVVVGSVDVDSRLLDLIEEHGRSSIGTDPVLVAADRRAGAAVTYRAAGRVRAGARGDDELVVLSAGADNSVMWLDVEGSLPALVALLSLTWDFPLAP